VNRDGRRVALAAEAAVHDRIPVGFEDAGFAAVLANRRSRGLGAAANVALSFGIGGDARDLDELFQLCFEALALAFCERSEGRLFNFHGRGFYTSVAARRAAAPRIGAAAPRAVAFDRDDFDVAEKALAFRRRRAGMIDELMSHRGEPLANFGRQRALFPRDEIGHPLMMNARRLV